MINNKNQFIYKSLRLITLFLLIGNYSHAQTAYLEHFTTQNGLPSNNCFYTMQDAKGYIWISTDAGISRFDGTRFTNFSIDDGLPDNQILQLKEDKKGRIWCLALNGQLSYFFQGKIYNETNDNILHSLKFNAVIVSFFEDSKGRMWFGTNQNMLLMLDGNKLHTYVSKDMFLQFTNTFIHEDKSGKIWVFSAHSIRLFNGSKFLLTAPDALPLSYRTALNLPDKTLLFLDKEGLILKDQNEKKLLFKVNKSLLNNNQGFFYATNKDLWLCNSNGIFHIRPNGKTTNYLEKIAAVQVIEDNKSNMWFTTTTDGIYMLPKQENRLYIVNKSSGLSNNKVKSIAKDDHNRIWLGLNNGNIDILDKKKSVIDKIKIPDLKKYNNIKQLCFDTLHHTVYFASDYGLGVINDIYSKKSVKYLKEPNNSVLAVKSFSIDKENGLAIAMSSGVALIKNRINHFEFSSLDFKNDKNFFRNRSYRVYYDKNQVLWFSNVNGLYKYSKDKLLILHEKSNILTKRINDIIQLSNGTIVLATDGFGLIFIKKNKIIKQLTQKQGLANNICKKIFVKKDQIWVITNNGINRIYLDGNNPLIEELEYTNVLLKTDVNDLYIDDDTAYFATNKGLVYLHNKSSERLKEAPKALVSSIISNGKLLNINKSKIILEPADNNISFYYSAVDFQHQNIAYRYRLKSSSKWTETKTRRIEFNSLQPGEYSFELSAKTINSSWGPLTSVNFVQKEHFWQSKWFLALLILLVGYALYKTTVHITKSQKNKEQQQLLLKNKILMLEQQALQAMMNPHFVFNVMNSIQHYINTKDTSSANKVLTGFARLIRKNLEICTKSFVSIKEEIEYLELYLNLEKKRFGEKFKYSIHIDERIDKEETLIPSMLLQPYIENAIWHGIMPKEEGGEVDIVIDLKNDFLLIRIIDNGIGIDNSLKNKKNTHLSKGMSLTQERINLLNQIEVNPIQITINQNGNSGTSVSIIIPNK